MICATLTHKQETRGNHLINGRISDVTGEEAKNISAIIETNKSSINIERQWPNKPDLKLRTTKPPKRHDKLHRIITSQKETMFREDLVRTGEDTNLKPFQNLRN